MSRRRDQRGAEASEYRSWYGTAEWSTLRLWRLRDEPLCRMCLPRLKPANIVDHVTPHRGDRDLFFSFENTQSLCFHHHNKWKQAMERSSAQAIDNDGWPIEQPFSWHPTGLRPSAVPLTIVCGPPAAGKTSYVATRKNFADLVIDLDELGAGLDGGDAVTWSRSHLRGAGEQRNKLLAGLAKLRSGRAWFIVGEPNASWRQWWADSLKPASIVVIETPAAVCLDRCERHERRRLRLAEYRTAVAAWWAAYVPRQGDAVAR